MFFFHLKIKESIQGRSHVISFSICLLIHAEIHGLYRSCTVRVWSKLSLLMAQHLAHDYDQHFLPISQSESILNLLQVLDWSEEVFITLNETMTVVQNCCTSNQLAVMPHTILIIIFECVAGDTFLKPNFQQIYKVLCFFSNIITIYANKR